MEETLRAHRLALSGLYAQLSPSPTPLLAAEEASLHSAVQELLQTQLSTAQSLLSAAQSTLSTKLALLHSWRTALGEEHATTTEQGPLLFMLNETEHALDRLKSRVQERGLAIIAVQEKLATFTTIFGKEWFRLELDFVKENGWEGIDLRLERLSQLEREVLRCEDELANRREVINYNLNEIFAIRTELGINSESPITPHSHDKANNPLTDPFDDLIRAHLGIGEKRTMPPTEENLLRVEAKRKWLEEEKEHRNLLIQSTYDKLHPLWSMLGVLDQEMESFVERWMGSTPDVIAAYQTELARMTTLKRSNLASFIQRERDLLTILWDKLYLSPTQRATLFPPILISILPLPSTPTLPSPNISEELLIAHERERVRAEEEVERMKGVLGRLERYFGVVEEMRELEISALDPGRLLGKATRGDPGRLLREEKARKRVGKEKPKLEQELRQIIPVWEKENHKPFSVNGKRFIDSLDEKIEAELADKEAKKRSKTPLTSSHNRTVPLKPSHTGPSLRAQHTGSSIAATSLKRQNTGGSTRSTTTTSGSTGGGGKKLVMSHTGGSTRGGGGGKVLGEIGNRTLGAGGGGTTMGGRSGMKVPLGWGGDSDPSFGASSTFPSATTDSTTEMIAGGGVGGGAFRPRTSADILNARS